MKLTNKTEEPIELPPGESITVVDSETVRKNGGKVADLIITETA